METKRTLFKIKNTDYFLLKIEGDNFSIFPPVDHRNCTDLEFVNGMQHIFGFIAAGKLERETCFFLKNSDFPTTLIETLDKGEVCSSLKNLNFSFEKCERFNYVNFKSLADKTISYCLTHENTVRVLENKIIRKNILRKNIVLNSGEKLNISNNNVVFIKSGLININNEPAEHVIFNFSGEIYASTHCEIILATLQ